MAECPHCGASFPAQRLACPECGSDAKTGWKSQEEIDYQAVELPEDPPLTRPGRALARWLVLLATVVAFALAVVLARR